MGVEIGVCILWVWPIIKINIQFKRNYYILCKGPNSKYVGSKSFKYESKSNLHLHLFLY